MESHETNSSVVNRLGFLIDFIYRYLEVLLRRVTVNVGQIVYSPSQKAFVSVSGDSSVPFAAEEYADLTGKKQ